MDQGLAHIKRSFYHGRRRPALFLLFLSPRGGGGAKSRRRRGGGGSQPTGRGKEVATGRFFAPQTSLGMTSRLHSHL